MQHIKVFVSYIFFCTNWNIPGFWRKFIAHFFPRICWQNRWQYSVQESSLWDSSFTTRKLLIVLCVGHKRLEFEKCWYVFSVIKISKCTTAYSLKAWFVKHFTQELFSLVLPKILNWKNMVYNSKVFSKLMQLHENQFVPKCVSKNMYLKCHKKQIFFFSLLYSFLHVNTTQFQNRPNLFVMGEPRWWLVTGESGFWILCRKINL